VSEQRVSDMILEIDIGNTCLKWRVTGIEEHAAGRCGHGINFLDDVNDRFGQVDLVRIACVAQEDVKNHVSARIFKLWGIVPQIAKTEKKHAGLEIAYQDPGRLGVDRWLAMLAAFSDSGKAVCVIDCGSAITVDLVNEQGLHVGGYIVPGIAMQIKALLSSTGQIRLAESVEASNRAWGRSTEEAVNFGVLRQATDFINAIVDELVADKVSPVFYITGGDADTLLPMLHCRERIRHCPDLVMAGLAIALS